MNPIALRRYLASELEQLKKDGLYKEQRIITSPQSALLQVGGKSFINLCANNYLGLANDSRIKQAAARAIEKWGFGMASVRFICGTQELHQQLEKKISQFLQTEDTILYSSCFDANTGLFETITNEEDAIISDSLNHASIIDGVRLSKAKRLRYQNNDLGDLEAKLNEAEDCRLKVICTDGVFSMDGIIANLEGIAALAKKYGALLMVDDSHAVGVLGAGGRGSIEHCQVMDKVDIITGTLGKALGGASGGYTSGPREIIEWLRQRSRPYLFSNTLAPSIAAASIAVLDLLATDGERLRATLTRNAQYFRSKMSTLGFTLAGRDHPIVPVMVGDAKVAKEMADALLAEGVYVIGFSFPVVPKGLARIRTQLSAGHTLEQLDSAIAAFAKVGKKFGLIK
jgi:glycine C-acetyltransferase